MNYAKWISDDLIQLPVAEDYLEDGTTLRTPELWSELREQSQPTDTSVFKSYKVKYVLISDSFLGNARRILQTWTPVYFEPEGRVAVLKGNELVFPQRNEYDRSGRLVCGYPNLPNSSKIQDGWYLIEETEKPCDEKSYRETGVLIEDAVFGHKIKIVWEAVPVVPEQPYTLSKFKLLNYLDNLGVLDSFVAFLNSDAKKKMLWDSAVSLESDNAFVVEAIEGLKTQFSLTDEQVKTMFKACVFTW